MDGEEGRIAGKARDGFHRGLIRGHVDVGVALHGAAPDYLRGHWLREFARWGRITGADLRDQRRTSWMERRAASPGRLATLSTAARFPAWLALAGRRAHVDVGVALHGAAPDYLRGHWLREFAR